MRKKKNKKPTVKKINHKELEGLLERALSNVLTPDDCEQIKNMAETIEYIIQLLDKKDVQLKRLLKQILGIKTEKSKKVIKDKNETDQTEPSTTAKQDNPEETPDKKKKGHGRNGVSSYSSADREYIPHATLKAGDPCLLCPKGKVYPLKEPGVFIHIEGSPPIQAKVYELEKLRCNLCGVIFEAELPIKKEKNCNDWKHYDETAKSIIVMLRYGYGFPLNRLSSLQSNLGVPLPVATAWDKSEEVANQIYPVFEALKQYGAQGEIFYNDDTGIKILSVMKEIEQEIEDANGKKIRTGIFTTGIVCEVDKKRIALFFSGRMHAGENLNDLLKKRNPEQESPIQMSDAKSGNTPQDTKVIECNCNAHARRRFVEVADNFPEECQYVIIDVFKEIYKNDAKAKNMNPDERLEFHKQFSGPIMDNFYVWLKNQSVEKKVEPNSGLGEAISYMLNHWPKLTRFLHIPNAPIDNNIVERTLKMGIRHRRNSLFYKTPNGAYIGDIFMSLIQTCTFNNINIFHYFTQLQIHSSEIFKNPLQWLPWNYLDTLAKLPKNRSQSSIDEKQTVEISEPG